MNIAQLSEQLKDVPQNTLVGYAKSPNSVVPQFLALAEIQRRQSLQAQVPAPSGTVADDVLAQAAPQPMAPQMDPRMMQAMQLPENQPGVAQLPSNVAPEGFANGGIVAFAGGGTSMLDDDEDEDIEMARLFPQPKSSRFEEILASLPAIAGGIRSLADKSSEKYKNVMSAVPSAAQVSDQYKSLMAAVPASIKGMRQDVSTAATGASDNIEEFLSKIKHLESRGRSFDSKGNILTSPKGAEGSMQVMPKTQINPGFGVTPARNKSPEELERVGRDYGIAMLNEFKDPKLAAMAYNWGPANVKKWLASDRSTPIPKETSKYASYFAEGGEVEEEDRLGPIDRALFEAIKNPGRTLGKAKDYISSLGTRYYGKNEQPFVNASPEDVLAARTGKYKAGSPAVQGIASLPASKKDMSAALEMTPNERNRYATIAENNRNLPPQVAAPYVPSTENYDIGFGANTYQPSSTPAAPVEVPKTQAQLYAEGLESMLAKQEAEAAQNKKLQLGLSLLGASAAGLQSASPYFSQGVGASLAGGVNTYGALKKQEAEAAKDIMGARLGMYKYGSAAENAAANRALEKEYKDLTLAQRERIAEADRGVRISEANQRQILAARDDLRQYEQMQLRSLEKRFPIPMPNDPNYQAALQAIYNSPEYQQLFALSGYTRPSTQTAPAGNRPPIGSFKTK